MEENKRNHETGKRILLQGAPNTRDLGGIQTADGCVIKEHKLIRSGALANLTEEDKRILKEEYQLSTVIDFRTETERSQKPDVEMDGVRYIHNPILEEETMGITREAGLTKLLMSFGGDSGDYMKQMYRSLALGEKETAHYKQFFTHLLEQEDGAVLWHCTAGKDRVGVGTALLLSVLGVERGTILADYLQTGTYLAQETEMILGMIGERLAKYPGAEKNIRTMLGVEREYLENVFEVMEAEYDSVENYLSSRIGLTEDMQENLRDKYLK